MTFRIIVKTTANFAGTQHADTMADPDRSKWLQNFVFLGRTENSIRPVQTYSTDERNEYVKLLNATKKSPKICPFALSALNPPEGILLGVGPASACTTACFTVTLSSYLALKEKVAVCAPTPDAMLIQAKMWYDTKEIRDEDWVIFDEGEFMLWAWPKHGLC